MAQTTDDLIGRDVSHYRVVGTLGGVTSIGTRVLVMTIVNHDVAVRCLAGETRG